MYATMILSMPGATKHQAAALGYVTTKKELAKRMADAIARYARSRGIALSAVDYELARPEQAASLA